MLTEKFNAAVKPICGGCEDWQAISPARDGMDDYAVEAVVRVTGMGKKIAGEEQKGGHADGRCVIHGDSISEKQFQTLK
jgi:hypothetical protein